MKGIDISRAIIFSFIFIALSILFSIWLGYFWRNSYFIFIISLFAAYYVYKKFPYTFEISRSIYILTLLMFLLTAYPLVLLHPYHSGSEDAVHVTLVRIIDEKIPETFVPYSDIRLVYQVGFSLFAKIFTDIFFFWPDYLILWFIGVLLASCQLILLYNFAATFLKSKTYGEWVAILFIGTKTVFQYSYWGQYPMLLAVDMFLLCFTLFTNDSKLYYLFFPVIFAVHPTGGAMIILALSVYCIFYKNLFKNFWLLLPSILLVTPSLFKTYLVLFINFSTLESSSNFVPSLSIEQIIKFIYPLPAWFGMVPSISAFFSLIYILRNKNLEKKFVFILSFLGISFLLYGLLYFYRYPNAGTMFSSITLFALLFAAISLEKSGINQHKFKNIFKVIVVLMCVLTFLSSNELTRLRGGSKISNDEAELAFRFNRFDPVITPTLFLSPGKAWMAHLSNKIPYDAKAGHLLPISDALSVHDFAWDELNLNRKKWEQIYENKCIDCIYELNVTYVVINKNYFNVTLKEKPVLQYKYFDVYRLK